jgi:hypothetical protein
MTTMNKKKDYCVKAAFRHLQEVSQKREMNMVNQQIQNLRQMNQDFDQKIKESEYQKLLDF